jgi:hypothetical protein
VNKNLLVAAVLTTFAAVSFAQAPEGAKHTKTTAAAAPASAASKPAHKHTQKSHTAKAAPAASAAK